MITFGIITALFAIKAFLQGSEDVLTDLENELGKEAK